MHSVLCLNKKKKRNKERNKQRNKGRHSMKSKRPYLQLWPNKTSMHARIQVYLQFRDKGHDICMSKQKDLH